MTAETDLCAMAKQYASRGFHVLPIDRDTKKPATRWRNGDRWSAATCDRAVIEWWFCEVEDRHWDIGIACGHNGLLVVDLDVKGAANGIDEFDNLIDAHGGDFPDGPTVRTRSGGEHRYLDLPVGFDVESLGNSAGKLGPGIDTRCTGGYVKAPPSPGYRWVKGGRRPVAPQWLLDALMLRPDPTSRQQSITPTRTHDGHFNLTGLIVTMRSARDGERNNILHWATHRVIDGILSGLTSPEGRHEFDTLIVEALRAGLSKNEIEATINSALDSRRVR